MGEYDNAGFPLSYCLLSTASATHVHKRTKALKAWVKCLRDKYGVIPRFAHTDKDMAEIRILRMVWVLKVQLCWWHLRDAVKTRLKKAKLSTTPYNAARAQSEFPWIDASFVPTGKPDLGKYEGGAPDEPGADAATKAYENPNAIPLRIPALTPRQPTPIQPQPTQSRSA